MRRPPKPVDDPMMWKLADLVQERLPDADHQDRVHLLEQLYELEQEALEYSADPGTLHSIRATQDFNRRIDPLIGAHLDDRYSLSRLEAGRQVPNRLRSRCLIFCNRGYRFARPHP